MGRWKDGKKNGFGVSTKAGEFEKIDAGIFKNGHLLLYELVFEKDACFWLYLSPIKELKE